MRIRPLIVVVVITTGFVIVFVRLADLMLLDHQKLLRLATLQHTKNQQILVRRGNIYDRRGKELALNLERPSLYGDPSMVDSPEKVAATLGSAIKASRTAIMRKLKEERRFVWLARKVSPEEAASVLKLNLKGIGLLPDSERFYPKGYLASHVLGFVDIDNRGLEGVEMRYEEFLSADGGRVYLTRDARGRILYRGGDYEERGDSIVLTIDEGLQYIVESELEKAVRQWRPSAATAVMMDPYTGEILALTNRPTFDPNRPGSYSPAFRRNRAVTDLYEPGSTFKIVAAAGVLEDGLATLNTRFDCSEGRIEVGGIKIRDPKRHEVLTLKEVVQKSSNVGAVKLALMLGPERFYTYMRRFGFGEKTGIDLTGEAAGLVKPPEEWSGTTIGAAAIGHEVMATSVQVLRAYSAVANGGYLVRPHVVSRIISPEGRVLWKKGIPERERIISERTAELLRETLVSVTEEDGTAPLAAIDGNRVAGKTGTSQMVDPVTGRYSHEDFVSSFVGFVPADDPFFVIIVVLWKPKGGYYGGEVAAPVFKAIAEKALSYWFIPRDDTWMNNILVAGRGAERPPRSRDF